MEGKELTKNHSKILYGIAILMMLYHHLFAYPERIGGNYVDVTKLLFSNLDIELKLAWFSKMCVGIYAFISGYGLYNSTKKCKDASNSMWRNLYEDYKNIIKHLISFYKKYWLVFIIFVPIGFVFFDRTFSLKEFLMNFIGKKDSYNAEWWYVFQYIKMLIVFPIIDVYFFTFINISYCNVIGVYI